MKNDRFLPSVIILGVVAIVAIVTLFLSNVSIEGNAVSDHVEYTTGDQFPCLDEDEVNDFYVAGVLRHGNAIYHDYCYNGKFLYQYSCVLSNEVELLVYKCPKDCKDGVCLK